MNLDILRKHNSIPGAKKVFFVPVNTLMTDFYDAFTLNGFELYSLNFAGNWNPKKYEQYRGYVEEIFLQTCRDVRPDWIYLLMDRPMISVKSIKEAKNLLPNSIFTNWTGDVRAVPKPGVIEIGKVIDITLIVSTGQIDLLKKHGLRRVEFLQTGVNVQKFCRFSEEKRDRLYNKLGHDIVFCANNHTCYPGATLRNKVVSRLCHEFGNKFAVYGKRWEKYGSSARAPIPYNDQNRVYNGSKIVISINNFNNIDMYFSARQLNGMAAGTLTLSAYIPGLEKYFKNKQDLVWFKHADECINLAKYYLEHNEEAREIGINGSQKVLAYHNKQARIKEISERLGFSIGDDTKQ